MDRKEARINTPFRFTFKPAEQKQKELIHRWLAQDHIKDWLHGDGLRNTLEGLEKFVKGSSRSQHWIHWIAYDNDTPFAYLLTSNEGEDAITLDLFICDPNYLGKGLSVQMIQEFLLSQFPKIKEVIIDPEVANTRAIHVYEKAGFRIAREFIATWHPVPHYQMRLKMDDLKDLCKKRQDVVIRPMRVDDIDFLVTNFCFPWSSMERTKELWQNYYKEQQETIRTVAVLEIENRLVGYGSLLRRSEYPHFSHMRPLHNSASLEKNRGLPIPEINAVWIDEGYRRGGLGKKLVTYLEDLARKEGYREVGIGVGLYKDYGAAQKLYFQLGYAPDGHGITYKHRPVVPGEAYPVDDDLILWLIKSL